MYRVRARWAVDLQCLRDAVHQRLPVNDVLEPAKLTDDEPRQRHAVAIGVHVGLQLGELLEQHVGQLGLQRVHLQEHAHKAVFDPVAGSRGCTCCRLAHGRQRLPQAGRVLPRVGETLDQLVASVVAFHRALQVLPELERVGGELVRPIGAESRSRFSELGEHFGLRLVFFGCPRRLRAAVDVTLRGAGQSWHCATQVGRGGRAAGRRLTTRASEGKPDLPRVIPPDRGW